MLKKWKTVKVLLSVLCICTMVMTVVGCGGTKYIESEITSEIDIPDANSTDGGSGESGESTDGKSSTPGKTNKGDGAGKGNTSTGGNKGTAGNENNSGNSGTNADTIGKTLKGSTVNILVWYDVPKAEQSVIDAFTKKTGIKVKFVKVAQKNYLTTLASRVGSGASPDLACIIGDTYPTPIVRGLFSELDTKYFNLNNSAYAKDVMDAYKWQGKYYTVAYKGSMMGDMYCVYFNKDMFEEKGVETPYEIWKRNPNEWTWKKFAELAKEMTYKTSDNQQIFGVSIAYPQAVMLSYGTDLIKMTDNGLVNNTKDTKLKEAWKAINELKTSQSMMRDNAHQNDLINKKVAMHVNGQWLMQKASAYSTGMKEAWGVAPFPKQDGGEYYVPFRGTMWGVPKNAKNVEGAAACLDYWLNPVNAESEVYASKECKEVHEWLWNQKKMPLMSEGILNFKKAGTSATIYGELMTGANAVDTTLDKYSGDIDQSISYAMDSKN